MIGLRNGFDTGTVTRLQHEPSDKLQDVENHLERFDPDRANDHILGFIR